MHRRDALKGLLLMGGMAFSGAVSRALAAGLQGGVGEGAFSAPQRAGVTAMADRIIPATDTPGAVEAGAVQFIEEIVFRWYTPAERDIFLRGLQQADVLARDAGAGSFVELSPEQQDALLTQLEQEALRAQGAGGFSLLPSLDEDLSPFFAKLKELVVVGYYTSEVGATQELRFNPMPMQYRGDIPLAEVGRAWSDSGF